MAAAKKISVKAEKMFGRLLQRLPEACDAAVMRMAEDATVAIEEQRAAGIAPDGSALRYEASTAKRKRRERVDKYITGDYRRDLQVIEKKRGREGRSITVGPKSRRNKFLAEIFNEVGLKTKRGRKQLPDLSLTDRNAEAVVAAGEEIILDAFKF